MKDVELESGSAFVALFNTICFGEKCEVEIRVSLEGDNVLAKASWQPLLGQPTSVTLGDLQALAEVLKQKAEAAALLTSSPAGATVCQVRFEKPDARIVVTRREKKEAIYSLTVGPFTQAGDLSKLKDAEVLEAIATLEELVRKTKQHCADARTNAHSSG